MKKVRSITLMVVIALGLLLALAGIVTASPSGDQFSLRPSENVADVWWLAAPFTATVQNTVTVKDGMGQAQEVELMWVGIPCNCQPDHEQYAQFYIPDLAEIGPIEGQFELVPPDGWSVIGRTFVRNMAFPTFELINVEGDTWSLVASNGAVEQPQVYLQDVTGFGQVTTMTWSAGEATFSFAHLGAVGPLMQGTDLTTTVNGWHVAGQAFVRDDFHPTKLFLSNISR